MHGRNVGQAIDDANKEKCCNDYGTFVFISRVGALSLLHYGNKSRYHVRVYLTVGTMLEHI